MEKRKPEPRKCAYCGKAKGTTAFRYYRAGTAVRDYFHPECFITFKAELEANDKSLMEQKP